MSNPAHTAEMTQLLHSLTAAQLARYFDHTLLRADAKPADIERICDEAVQSGFYSVCVNSAYVSQVAHRLSGTSVEIVSVVGFPLGAMSTVAKAFEARHAIENGATEIDMVISIGALKSGLHDEVLEDIRQVVLASTGNPVKVILETALLTTEEIGIACRLAQQGAASFVKTSTGFSTRGASREDVLQMRRAVAPPMGIKASGGIRTLDQTLEMILAGADRLGASAGVAILDEFRKARGLPNSPTSAGSQPSDGAY